MATVRIYRSEVRDDLLPRVCALTGQPTDAEKARTFAWVPGWTYFLLFAGLVPFLIIHLVMTKRMKVYLPLVPEKHGHWLYRQSLVVCGAFVALSLACGGAVSSETKDSAAGLFVMVAGGVLFLAVIVVGAVLTLGTIRPLEITDRYIRLTGVHEDFKAVLEIARAERRRQWDEEDRRYEEERRARRRRDDDLWRDDDRT